MLGVAIGAYVRPQIDLARRLIRRAEGHYLAFAGVQRAMLEVYKDSLGSYDAANDSWGNNNPAFANVLLGKGSFSLVRGQDGSFPSSAQDTPGYGLSDEEGKININKASLATLKGLFEIAAGLFGQDAEDVAAAIVDWRDEDSEPQENGAEDGYYSTLSPAYPCKNADFQAREELLLVKGINREIFDKIKEVITLYGEGAVNINSADKVVLRSLGLDDALVEKVIAFRKGPDGSEGTDDDNVFTAAGEIVALLDDYAGLSSQESDALSAVISSGPLSVVSDNFRGWCVAKLAGKTAGRIEFVVNRAGDIMFWREE